MCVLGVHHLKVIFAKTKARIHLLKIHLQSSYQKIHLTTFVQLIKILFLLLKAAANGTRILKNHHQRHNTQHSFHSEKTAHFQIDLQPLRACIAGLLQYWLIARVSIRLHCKTRFGLRCQVTMMKDICERLVHLHLQGEETTYNI